MSLEFMGIVSGVTFLLAAFFAGAETAIIAADRIRARHLSIKGDKRATELLKFFERPQYFLSIVLVGTNLCVIGCTSAFTAIMVDLYGDSGTTVATAILVPTLLVFEEIIPKGIFLYYADKAAILSIYPLKFFGILLYPVIKIFAWFSNALARLFRTVSAYSRYKMSEEELLFHFKGSREAGLIPKDTLTLASRAFDLVSLSAEDVMVPIEKVAMVEDLVAIDEYDIVFLRTRFTRLPVYRGSKSNVVGILSIQNLLKTRGPHVDIPELENVYDVATDTPISEILIRMKNHGCHMAMIRNDEGTIVGMTTLEDILERLVGAISDEFH